MSKLGVLGAIGGAGKGIMENARVKQEAAAVEARSRIDEARERRLLEYKEQIATRDREDTQGHDKDMVGEQAAATSVLNAEQNAAVDTRQDDQQEHLATEGQADRESNERIAGMRAQGSASEAEIKALERFEPRTSTIKVMGENGFPTEQDVSTIYDKDTKRTYIQQGDRFVAQGVDPTGIRPAPAAAIDALAENPDRAVEFLEKFNYLPARFMEALPNSRTNRPR
jgi:hypothetical protein